MGIICRLALTLPSVIALAISGEVASGQALADLQITSPLDGSTVLAGQAVSGTVTSPSGKTFPQGVWVTAESPLPGAGPITGGPPFHFAFVVPPGATAGSYHLTAASADSSGKLVFSSTITLKVDKQGTATQVKVSPAGIKFGKPGDRIPLNVLGVFADGSSADLSQAPKTAYSSQNVQVAVVSAYGVVTAVRGGTTNIVVSYSGLTVSVPVSVPITIPGDLDGDGKVTCSDVAIIKSSFGLRSTQPGFEPRADVNGDGVVDVRDLAFVSQKLPAGTTCP